MRTRNVLAFTVSFLLTTALLAQASGEAHPPGRIFPIRTVLPTNNLTTTHPEAPALVGRPSTRSRAWPEPGCCGGNHSMILLERVLVCRGRDRGVRG